MVRATVSLNSLFRLGSAPELGASVVWIVDICGGTGFHCACHLMLYSSRTQIAQKPFIVWSLGPKAYIMSP